jgi:hypothetical protein
MHIRIVPRRVTMLCLLLLAVVLVRPGLTCRATGAPRRATTGHALQAAPSAVRDSSGRIHLVYYENVDGAYDIRYTSSVDEGSTWNAPLPITAASSTDWFPGIAVGQGGKLWVFWSSDRANPGQFDLWYRTSVDGGATWADAVRFTEHELWDYAPRVLQATDGRLWVVWYSYRSGNWDVWYSTSDNAGVTWSAATQLTFHTHWDYNPDITQLHDGTIWVVWHSGRSGNMDIWGKRTSDGGASWTADTRLTTDPAADMRAAIAQSSDRTVWLFWHSTRTGQTDIHYKLSTDGGNTWSADHRYTRFAGIDQEVSAVALTGGRVALFWRSDRAVSEDIWMAVPGYDEDLAPPPHYEYSHYEPQWVTYEDTVHMQVMATDDVAVASVSLVWTLDGVAQSELTLYDDGQHDDGEAGDGLFAAHLGPFPESSVVGYRFRIRDTAGSEIVAPLAEGIIRVQGPFVRAGDVLLVLDQGPQSSAWFEPYFVNALNAAGHTYDVWACDQRGDVPAHLLREYADVAGVVVWAVPDAGYLGSTETQRNLEDFLDEGGNLFVVGQDAGFNLRDSALLRDYFVSRMAQDDIGLYALHGVPDDILDGLYLVLSPVYADPYDGADNQAWPSELDAGAPAVVIARYDPSAGTGGAHIQGAYVAQGAGAVRIDGGHYRAVIMGFGLEALQSDAVRAQVMIAVLAWLRGETAAPTPTAMPDITPTATPAASLTPTQTATPKYPTPTATVTPPAAATATLTPTPMATATPFIQEISLQQGQDGYSAATDTYLYMLDPDTPFGQVATLQVHNDGVASTLIRFDLSSLPRNIRVNQATLRVYAVDREGQTLMVVSAYPVLRPWRDDESTWNQVADETPWAEAGCNGIDADREGTSTHNTMVVQAGQWYAFGLADEVIRWLQSPWTNRGVLLRSASKTFSRVGFASAEYHDPTLRPQLVISYELLPESDAAFVFLPLILRQ